MVLDGAVHLPTEALGVALNKRIIIIFGFIWLGIIAYNGWYFGRPHVGKSSVMKRDGAQNTTAPATASLNSIPSIRLDLLEMPPIKYSGVLKDIFSPIKVELPRSDQPIQEPPPIMEAVPPPSQLKIFTSEVRFMGFVKKDENNRMVFLYKGGDIFMVKEGDSIDGRYTVKEISETGLILKDEQAGEEGGIDLVKR